MQHCDTQQQQPIIYESFHKNGPLHPHYEDDKPEQIYCDPEILKNNNSCSDEKHAVKLIMEKYDSLRCLDSQMDNLQVSSESGDSITKAPLEDSEDEAGELSERDITQVEVFFRSHKTYICVCRCLAHLYFYNTDGGEWELARTGIPVLLLDKGETRARNKRMLQIVLAEKGSGFVLWKDVIDNLSNYRAQDGSTFQTMYLSSDHRKMAGLSFVVQEAAEKFLREVEQLTADPLNISLSVPKQKKKKLKSFKKEKVKLAKKCDISTPCCFEHVTSVALNDKKKLFSLTTLVSPGEQVSS